MPSNTPSSPLAAILFDADGVVIRSDMASRYFERTYGINHKDLVAFYLGPFSDCLLGKKDMYDVLPAYLEKWGWQKSPEQFVQEWYDYENKVDEQLVGYIQKLRARGLQCFLATNQEKHRLQYMLDVMKFCDHFDGVFASCELGVKKPDPVFFERILERLGAVDKSTVLLWDDSAENVAAAHTFGIQAEIYHDFTLFEESIADRVRLQG